MTIDLPSIKAWVARNAERSSLPSNFHPQAIAYVRVLVAELEECQERNQHLARQALEDFRNVIATDQCPLCGKFGCEQSSP